MFQTKGVEKINTHSMFSNYFRESCRSWDEVKNYCRVRQDLNDNIIWHTRTS